MARPHKPDTHPAARPSRAGTLADAGICAGSLAVAPYAGHVMQRQSPALPTTGRRLIALPFETER